MADGIERTGGEGADWMFARSGGAWTSVGGGTQWGTQRLAATNRLAGPGSGSAHSRTRQIGEMHSWRSGKSSSGSYSCLDGLSLTWANNWNGNLCNESTSSTCLCDVTGHAPAIRISAKRDDLLASRLRTSLRGSAHVAPRSRKGQLFGRRSLDLARA